jgi:large subunit ribosomal protein L23
MNAFEVIKSVRLTEKGAIQAEKINQYTVVADRRANKVQIRQAVQELFKVTLKEGDKISLT